MQSVKDAANAIVGKVKEVTSIVTHDSNKEATKNDSFSTVDEKNYNSKKETTEQRGVIGHIGDTISNAYNFVAEKVQEAATVVSFDPNKDKVKNPDNTINERGSTGFATAGDKIEEKSHHARAENT